MKVFSRFSIVFFVATAVVCAFLSIQLTAKADVGYEFFSMDKAADPAENFYQYAVGNWLKNNQIPEGHSRWGAFLSLAQKTVKKQQAIVESLGQSARGHEEELLAAFYQSFLDMERRNTAGVAPVQHLLDKVESVENSEELITLTASMQATGFVSPFFYWGVGPNPRDNTKKILSVREGGLHLPDQDMYLEEKDTQANHNEKKRVAYLAYIRRIFQLAGANGDEAEVAARQVMHIETAMARSFLAKEDGKNPDKIIHLFAPKEMPSLPWEKIFALMKIQPEVVNVRYPEYFVSLQKILTETPTEHLKNYLRFSILEGASDALSMQFDEAQFHFYSRTLNGIQQPKPIEERGIGRINRLLGDALGKLYVAKHFSPEKKAEVEQLVARVVDAVAAKIQSLSWLGDETKTKALEKLRKMVILIGYPDDGYWIDYGTLSLDRKDSFGVQVQKIKAFLAKRKLDEIGKPVDKLEWFTPPQTVNAFNSPVKNLICFPAGILDFPFITDDLAVNYGAFGMVIGHEIIHSFDAHGRKFDSQGNVRDWWTAEDAAKFQVFEKLLIEQFNKYSIAFSDGTSMNVNGKLTIGENIADLGGLHVSFSAMQAAMKENPIPTIQGFSPEQRFFLGYAQVWRRLAIVLPKNWTVE